MSFKPYILQSQTTGEKDILLITTPSNNGQRPTNPRGAKVVSRVAELAVRNNVRLEQLIINYQANITEQVRTKLNAMGLDCTRVIVAAGDGSAALILNALRDTAREILVVPGGTINLLARQMGTTQSEQWTKFVHGTGMLRPLYIRRLVMTTKEGEVVAHIPWTNFCGVGLGARFLAHYDSANRAYPTLWNVVKAAASAAPEVFTASEPQIELVGVANPLFGPSMNLGTQSDYLSNFNFGTMMLGPDVGPVAAMKFVALQVLVHNPLRDLYWMDAIPDAFDRIPGHSAIRKLFQAFRPSLTDSGLHTGTIEVQAGETIYWHGDGSPFMRKFKKRTILHVTKWTHSAVWVATA